MTVVLGSIIFSQNVCILFSYSIILIYLTDTEKLKFESILENIFPALVIWINPAITSITLMNLQTWLLRKWIFALQTIFSHT